uniref:Mitochondrial import inner membrane translocase subunit TIM50 n=1 Tax=Catharus ustulatus TaxID=91951 RepID=A0A8C3U5X2_CATUS
SPSLCQIFIYTTAKKDYAKKLLEVLDPKKKLIRFGSDCVCSQGCYWKDLTRLGRDLAKTVALDHTMQGFPAQVGGVWDEELLRLIPALSQLGISLGVFRAPSSSLGVPPRRAPAFGDKAPSPLPAL